MPTLIWSKKNPPVGESVAFDTEALVFPQGRGYPHTPAENFLFWGDNLQVMQSLLPEYEQRVNLIYADPPFYSNKRYPTRIGRGEDSRRPSEWQLTTGYADHWPDMDTYLDFLHQRIVLMHRLLAPSGTLYLHLDWHADAYARILLDEVFGTERLLNQIVWLYHGPSPIKRAFNRKHDIILAYTKSKDYVFNADAVREPYHPTTVKTFETSTKAGFGKMPDLMRGKVPEDWWYFPVVARLHNERSGYPTQKPEALLERIVKASSNPGDIVADFFCGSGTTPLVAARLGRKFLACDSTWNAVHISRLRLVDMQAAVPFAFMRDPRFTVPASSGNLELDIDRRTIRIRESPSLDYWEIDPDWDSRTFRSMAQSRRSNRSEKIDLELTLGCELKRACIRAITVKNEQIQKSPL